MGIAFGFLFASLIGIGVDSHISDIKEDHAKEIHNATQHSDEVKKAKDLRRQLEDNNSRLIK